MARASVRYVRDDDGSLRETDLRSMLLTESARLFAEQSFPLTTVQEICEAAGVTKGGFYHYFSSKDELLYEMYVSLLRVQAATLDQLLESDLSTLEKLREVAEHALESILKRFHEAVAAWRSFDHLSPERQAITRAETRRYHQRVRQLVEEAQGEGIVRTDISAEVLITFFFGTARDIGSWYHVDGPWTPTDVAQTYGSMFISTLTNPSMQPG